MNAEIQTEETPSTKNKSKATRRPLGDSTKFVPPIHKPASTAKDNARMLMESSDGDDTTEALLATIAQNAPIPAKQIEPQPVHQEAKPSLSAEPGKLTVSKAGKEAASKNLKKVTDAVKNMNSANKDAKRTSMDWPKGYQSKIKMLAVFRKKANMKEYLISLIEADIQTLPPGMKAALECLED